MMMGCEGVGGMLAVGWVRRYIGISATHRVGRLRIDSGAIENEYSERKTYDSMTKYQSIQSFACPPITC